MAIFEESRPFENTAVLYVVDGVRGVEASKKAVHDARKCATHARIGLLFWQDLHRRLREWVDGQPGVPRWAAELAMLLEKRQLGTFTGFPKQFHPVAAQGAPLVSSIWRQFPLRYPGGVGALRRQPRCGDSASHERLGKRHMTTREEFGEAASDVIHATLKIYVEVGHLLRDVRAQLQESMPVLPIASISDGDQALKVLKGWRGFLGAPGLFEPGKKKSSQQLDADEEDAETARGAGKMLRLRPAGNLLFGKFVLHEFPRRIVPCFIGGVLCDATVSGESAAGAREIQIQGRLRSWDSERSACGHLGR